MKRVYWGKGRDVETFTPAQRRAYGLATEATIVEIEGDDAKMQEMAAYCREKGIVGFDTETTGLDFFNNRIILIQIGDNDRQYLIWADHTNLEPLLDVLRDPDVVKIGLNLKFDLTFSLYQFGRAEARARNVVDVMLTAQVLMCGIYDNVGLTMKMSSMETQARHWLGLDIPKDPEIRIGWEGYAPSEFTSNNPDEVEKRRKKILYAADDVCIPISIAKEHKSWIQHLELTQIVNLENRFLPALADIEVIGMPFDQEAWMELAREAEANAREARHKLDTMFDVRVTIEVDEAGNAVYERDKKYTSPIQLVDLIREWMWDNCGVDVIANNKHFEESLRRYGRIPEARLDMLFTSRQEPDPENPGKNKKVGYPNMKDTLHRMWDLYRQYLPPQAFILPDTDSKTLKFFKVIYHADSFVLAQDAEHLPTTYGLPKALVDPILDLRGNTKSASTYGRNWLNRLSDDGRIHTDFRQASLSTGRLSSTPNAQNFPADSRYRMAFKTTPGRKMVGADYSQIEPRVLAHLSQDPTYMRVFWSEFPNEPGFQKWCDSTVTEVLDLYTEVGKEIGQIPRHYTKLDTKGDEDAGIDPKPDGAKGRKQAKIANLGLGYGTGVKKFHYMLCIDTKEYHSLADVQKLYDDYWSAMGVVKAFLDAASALTDPKSSRKADHPYVPSPVTYAETILGRKRFFTETNKGHWTQGRNMPIQGAAGGDMLKLAALELTEWVWENEIDGGIVNLIHDELLADVREDQAEAFALAMKKTMESVGARMCPTVPIVADTYIRDYWKK